MIEQPTPTLERRPDSGPRYSAVAAIDLMAADLRERGEIRPQTRERVWNESLTFLLEGLDAPLQKPFDREFIDGHLLAEDGTRLIDMLNNGLRSAEYDAAIDPRKQFEVDRRRAELQEYAAIQAMMQPESQESVVVSISAFPEEAAALFGPQAVGDLGYQTSRRLGFIRVHTKMSPQSLKSTTLSIDNSSLAVLQRAFGSHLPEEAFSHTTNLLAQPFSLVLDQEHHEAFPFALRDAFDSALAEQFVGEEFYAGRRSRTEKTTDDLVAEQLHLFTHYIDGLDALSVARAVDSIEPQSQAASLLQALLQAQDEKGQQLIPEPLQRRQLEEGLRTGVLTDETLELAKTGLDFITWAQLRAAMLGVSRQSTNFADFIAAGAGDAAGMVASGEVIISCGGSSRLSAKSTEQQSAAAVEAFLLLTRGFVILSCVNCPFCRKVVDAKKTKQTLSCLSCKAEVDLVSGKPTGESQQDPASQPRVSRVDDYLLQLTRELFGGRYQK